MLESKAITKTEFNNKNNEIFLKINLRPFTVLDSFDKALFNYNYYNSKAKVYLQNYLEQKKNKNDKKAKIALNNMNNNYYHKDLSIMAMINFEKAENIEAYFIKMHSKNLASEIYEINFTNRERIILHTKNKEIKELLIKNKCFNPDKRSSLIESYINN